MAEPRIHAELIFSLHDAGWTIHQLAQRFNTSNRAIRNVIHGRTHEIAVRPTAGYVFTDIIDLLNWLEIFPKQIDNIETILRNTNWPERFSIDPDQTAIDIENLEMQAKKLKTEFDEFRDEQKEKNGRICDEREISIKKVELKKRLDSAYFKRFL